MPNSLQSYKTLNSNYKCSTFLMRTASYFVSFKFSLILISYFCLRPRFKGDYNESNWKHFNRLSLTFICLPYPLMMYACGYFLYSEGLFSYTSFVAIEVICISTVMAILMLVDAMQGLRCR